MAAQMDIFGETRGKLSNTLIQKNRYGCSQITIAKRRDIKIVRRENKMEDNKNIISGQNVHFCASCKSENIQKLSLAYMSGSSKTQGVGLGVGMGGGVGLGVGTGTNQTLLSSMVAPPKITSPLVGAVGIWIVIIMLSSIFPAVFPERSFTVIPTLILFILSFWGSFKFYRYLPAKNKTLMEEYNKKYICLRCGNIFALN